MAEIDDRVSIKVTGAKVKKNIYIAFGQLSFYRCTIFFPLPSNFVIIHSTNCYHIPHGELSKFSADDLVHTRLHAFLLPLRPDRYIIPFYPIILSLACVYSMLKYTYGVSLRSGGVGFLINYNENKIPSL